MNSEVENEDNARQANQQEIGDGESETPDVAEDENEDLVDEDDFQEEGEAFIEEVEHQFNNNAEDDAIVVYNDESDSDGIHDDDEDEDDESEDETEETFDTALPTSHSYLGDDLETLQGRTIHADGEHVILPLFHIPNIVIVPGQILPLNLFHPQAVSMMRRVIQADKTFGLLISKPKRRGGNDESYASVGVTCEIFSVKEEQTYGLSHMLLKAEGRQRFKLISRQSQLDGVTLGKIVILPDAYISPQPQDSLLLTQTFPRPNAIRSQVISNRFSLNDKNLPSEQQRFLIGFNPSHAQLLCTSLTSIQGWTYKLYNPYFLMDCLLHEIRSWNENLKFNFIPHNPIDFSYWITKNLPLTNEMKIELLQIDSAPLRLRKQIEFMNRFGSGLACEQCESLITDKNELFSLSKRGPMGAYVNPGGHVHETVTFHKANNLSLQGYPSEEYSWFPGYAWTIALCKTCRRHMGWKFTAAQKDLKPKKFWGLTRAALKPVFKNIVPEEEEKPPEDPRPPDSGGGVGGEMNNTRRRSIDFTSNIQYESSI